MHEMQVPWGMVGPGIAQKGLVDFFNSNKNTAAVITRIFGIPEKDLPASWTGKDLVQLFR